MELHSQSQAIDSRDRDGGPRAKFLIWKSEELLRGDKEVLIAHRGEFYRLRETRNGKLIMGK